VSLPNGANSLPISLLKFFERFDRIYLWLDADPVGQNAVEKFSGKLGHNRVLIINSRLNDAEGPKDANDVLLRGLDMQQVIRECTSTVNDRNLLVMSDLKDKVMNRIVNQN
jgi:hypothetical protein